MFYPVIALLDDTFIVVHMTGPDSLRLEPALATPGGEPGLAVSIGIDPAEQEGKYLVVFTPAALLGKPPPPDREGDMLSLSALAYHGTARGSGDSGIALRAPSDNGGAGVAEWRTPDRRTERSCARPPEPRGCRGVPGPSSS